MSQLNSTRLATTFAVLFGAFLGLALLKFGNPPIMEKWTETPADIYEFLLGSPWPISWAYHLLVVLVIAGVLVAGQSTGGRLNAPAWMVGLPLLWLVCQVVASAHSIDNELSWPTLKHFTACVVCFYLGLFALARVRDLHGFWVGLFCAFLLVLALGWEQHFGGLQATREYFFREIYPRLKEVSPEYLKKVSSNRIFSTLFYPNSLAGALLLMLPIMLLVVGHARGLLTLGARNFLGGALAIAALGCLFWSGSKGGWLLMLFLALLALLQLRSPTSLKLTLLSVVLVAGLIGFISKYAGFFERGATSVGARFDYWQAALKTARANPWFGTGPGTFAIPYKRLKRPESEMTRLVHNDYLEQATDSGWISFCAYSGFIVLGLAFGLKPARLMAQDQEKPVPNPVESGQKGGRVSSGKPGSRNPPEESIRGRVKMDLRFATSSDQLWRFFLWLGVLGWALQSLFDFGLYIPALAWPAFTFLGLLLGRIPSTNPGAEPNLRARNENPVPQRA